METVDPALIQGASTSCIFLKNSPSENRAANACSSAGRKRASKLAGGARPPASAPGPGESRFEELSVGGTIVGAFEDAAYVVADVRLARGDLLLLYTDGLVDSMNFREERFETDRVRQAMQRFADQPARQILGNIRWEVRKFTGLTPRVDDLTMVALKIG